MPSSFHIDVRSNIKDLTKSFDAFTKRQLPFATATALTSLARLVAAAEHKTVLETFPTATPFTLNGIGVRGATKRTLTATIYMKELTAIYLTPYLSNAPHHLNSRALLNPKNVQLNAYGNLRKGKLASLKARPDVFIGTVHTKSGLAIAGVWQRPYYRPVALRAGKKRGKGSAPRAANTSGHLKLLIRFGDALPVRQHLPWGQTAQGIVSANIQSEFGAAMARAIATAR